jgi:hypothetical protein
MLIAYLQVIEFQYQLKLTVMKKRHIILLVIFFAFTTNISAQVDSVIFNTHDYVVGEIKNMQRGILQIETDYSDSDFKIEWDKTIEIYSVSQFLITLSNGEQYFGTLESLGDSIIQIVISENEIIEVRNQDIVYLNAYDDKFLDRFSASISLGFDMAKARNLKQLTTRSSVGYKADKWNASASYYNLTSTQDATEDINRQEADASFSYLLPYRLYGIATVSYLSNTEQSIDTRINAQLGAGRYLVQSNRMDWGLKLGVNRNIEYYTNDTEDRQSWEGYFGTDYNIFDLGDLDLLLSIMVYPSFTEAGRWRSDSKFDIKYEFPLDFFVKMGVSVNYDNRPANDAPETDYVFNISFGWEW